MTISEPSAAALSHRGGPPRYNLGPPPPRQKDGGHRKERTRLWYSDPTRKTFFITRATPLRRRTRTFRSVPDKMAPFDRALFKKT